MLYSCTHMATVGVKGLTLTVLHQSITELALVRRDLAAINKTTATTATNRVVTRLRDTEPRTPL